MLNSQWFDIARWCNSLYKSILSALARNPLRRSSCRKIGGRWNCGKGKLCFRLSYLQAEWWWWWWLGRCCGRHRQPGQESGRRRVRHARDGQRQLWGVSDRASKSSDSVGAIPRNRSSRPWTIDPGQLLPIDSTDRLDFWPLTRLDSTQPSNDRLDRFRGLVGAVWTSTLLFFMCQPRAWTRNVVVLSGERTSLSCLTCTEVTEMLNCLNRYVKITWTLNCLLIQRIWTVIQ